MEALKKALAECLINCVNRFAFLLFVGQVVIRPARIK